MDKIDWPVSCRASSNILAIVSKMRLNIEARELQYRIKFKGENRCLYIHTYFVYAYMPAQTKVEG